MRIIRCLVAESFDFSGLASLPHTVAAGKWDNILCSRTGHTNCHLGDDITDALVSEGSGQEEGPLGFKF